MGDDKRDPLRKRLRLPRLGARGPSIPDGWAGTPLFILFFIPAPIPLAIPNGNSITVFRDEEDVDWLRGMMKPIPGYESRIATGKNFVSIQTWQHDEPASISMKPLQMALNVYGAGIGMDDIPHSEIMAPAGVYRSTTFEVVTPLLPASDHLGGINIARSVSDAFDRSLDALNQLYRAYILQSKDPYVYPLNRRNVFSLIPWTTRSPYDFVYGAVSYFQANENPPFLEDGSMPVPRRPLLSQQEWEEAMAAFTRILQKEPLMASSEHRRVAERSFVVHADYASTVVWSHTFIETFLDSVLLSMTYEERISEDDVRDLFASEQFFKRLRTQYSRLSEKWNPNDETTIIGRWIKDVRFIRNDVLHHGYIPTEHEALQALTTAGEMAEFVKEEILVRRQKYPRTTLLLFGMPGLDSRGLWGGELKDMAEQDMLQWIASFQEWSARIRRER